MTPSHLSVNRDADAQDDPKPETIVRTAIARAYDILCGTARTCTTIPEADALGMGDQTIEITQLLHPTRIGLPQARTESSEMHEESETCGDATSCVDKLIGRWKSWKYWERERFADGWRPDAAARVLGNAERDIYRHLMHILDSRDARHMVRELGADEAVLFLNAVQHVCISTVFAIYIFLMALVIA
jgi:hypothetical protein